MEFPKTASQNTDHAPPSNPSLLIRSPYLVPSLTLSFTNMAVQGPVIERLCLKWTADPSDQTICKRIVFFSLLTAGFFSSLYLPIVSYLFRYLSSSIPILMLYCREPSWTRSYVSHSKYSPFVTSMIRCLSLPLWCQAVDSSLGVGLWRPFPSSRACTEGETFIDNHMRWSEQGLLWGIDSGDYCQDWLLEGDSLGLSLTVGDANLYTCLFEQYQGLDSEEEECDLDGGAIWGRTKLRCLGTSKLLKYSREFRDRG